jgi:hypothetical protein
MTEVTRRDRSRSSKMLSVAEAAEQLRVSKSWLNKSRVLGGGPAFRKFGRKVVYDATDLEEFARSRKFRTTSDADYPVGKDLSNA